MGARGGRETTTTPRAAGADRPPAPAPAPRGRGLSPARAGVWALAALSVAYYAIDLPGRFPPLTFQSGLFSFAPAPPAAFAAGLADLGLTPRFHSGYIVALSIIRAIAFFLAGAIIVWRRPADRMALLIALLLVTTPNADAYPPTLHALAVEQPVRAAIGRTLEAIGFTLLLWLFLLFPDGRFRPRWTRPVAAGWLTVGVGTLFLPGSPPDMFTWPPALFAAFFLATLGTAVAARVWRYRRTSGPVERQQTKWVALGLTAVLVNFAASAALSALAPPGWATVPPASLVLADLLLYTVDVLCFVALPAALAVAVLRHRLFDIDILINRALVYGALTGILAMLYLGGVIVLQRLAQALTGQAGQNQLAIVASTLTIAALFQPLRRRIQAFIDRRFYRRKYDAARTLTAFGAQLRNATDLDRLSADLVTTVRETMQPTQVSLWLRPPDDRPRRE